MFKTLHRVLACRKSICSGIGAQFFFKLCFKVIVMVITIDCDGSLCCLGLWIIQKHLLSFRVLWGKFPNPYKVSTSCFKQENYWAKLGYTCPSCCRFCETLRIFDTHRCKATDSVHVCSWRYVLCNMKIEKHSDALPAVSTFWNFLLLALTESLFLSTNSLWYSIN